MRYLNKCPHCGEYPVERESFMSQVPAALQSEVERVENDENSENKVLVFSFTTSCPRCKPVGASVPGTLSVRTMK
jgi:hypothetical protein